MGADEFSHAEATDFVFAENLSHPFVRLEVLLVLRILEVVLLNISPQLFNALAASGLASTDDGSEVVRDAIGFREASTLRHFAKIWKSVRKDVWKKLRVVPSLAGTVLVMRGTKLKPGV